MFDNIFAVAVSKDSPYQSIQDIVKDARRNACMVSYGTPGTGSIPHLGTSDIEAVSKVELTHVPYKGDAPMLQDLLTGRLQKYQHAHTKAWCASVDAADAFVLVLPEYNFGPPSALLNAMNYLVREWQYKPAAFVSYGGMSGGLRAVQVTKQLLTTLKVMPMLEAVAIPNVGQPLDAEKPLHRTIFTPVRLAPCSTSCTAGHRP